VRKVIAFLTALALLMGTIYGIHIYSKQALALNNNAFGTWINQTKFGSPDGIKANMNDNTLVIFGSSEFKHGNKTIYHPKAMFQGFSFNPMLIGEGFYQCLSHAITLASIGDSIPNKKVVLFLSPTWFREEGVDNRAFASRFYESSYLGMLKNNQISKETKEYIRNRVNSLLTADPSTLKRVKLYNHKFLDGKASVIDDINYHIYDAFLTEKSRQSVIIQAKLSNIKPNQNQGLKDRKLKWKKYLKKAKAEGKKRNKNPFYMDPHSLIRLEARKNDKTGTSVAAVKFGYADSPEYGDLRCFLDICKELDLDVMVVALPVNGYWFDYNAFPISEREKYYTTIQKMMKEYGVEFKDLSDQEYTKYFFEDGVHLGGKGWVMVNEAIYNFYKQDQK
jgi:D-alanine transfer protein